MPELRQARVFPKKTSYAEKLSFDSQRSISYEFPVNGFVYFQGDTLSNNGFALFNFHEDIIHQVDILIQSLLPPLKEPPLVGWDVSARPAQSVAWVAPHPSFGLAAA